MDTSNFSKQDMEDYQRVKRYVEQGDKTFLPYLEWFENGKSRPIQDNQQIQHQTAQMIRKYYPNLSPYKLHKKFGIYQAFFYRLERRRYSSVPVRKCKALMRRIKREQSDNRKVRTFDDLRREKVVSTR